nr:hypothetical protein [Tanacetum cinerariifolium]
MSTQQDIYAAGSKNRPPMLNKENYVPCDANHEVSVNETFHEQTDDELTKKELKQVEADDQAILLGVPKDIYVAVDSYETAQEIWLRQGIEGCYHPPWRPSKLDGLDEILKPLTEVTQQAHVPA